MIPTPPGPHKEFLSLSCKEDNTENEFLMSGGEIGTLDILDQNPFSNHEADTACICAV